MLGHILRAGDRVRMKMDHESREYATHAVPDGTLGTITHRYRAEGIIEARYPRSRFREPGVYAKDGVHFVAWDDYPEGVDPTDPEWSRTNDIHMEPADTFFKEYNERLATLWPVRLADGSPNPDFDIIREGDKLDNLVRTGDLPETPLWELDEVMFRGNRHRITRISYRLAQENRDVFYDIEGIDEHGKYDRRGTTSAIADELILMRRGSVWNEAHGVPLVFRSLAEEANYATNTNRAHSVRNPVNKLYSWTIDEVLQAIKDDIVDGFTNPITPFSGTRRINAHRFDDRDLGLRMRQETLKGFATNIE